VEPELEGWRFIAENVLEFTFVYAFERDASEVHLVSRLDEITQSDHRHLLQIGTDTDARQTILSRDYPEITIDYTMGIPLWVTAYEFLVFGVEHIVTGYDHLAFLAGVIMATSGLVALAKVVTAFTLGHSVTLVLASLDVVTMPSRFIESIIALSIVYVALENFLGRKLVERWVLTFLFGLIHGFGFSNVLRELGLSSGRMVLSLFSFNLGVEVGQLAFVVVLFPLLLALGKTRWKEPVMAGVSVAVMSLGFYWFVQRAVFG
jgi:hydrogenase/urease accessory protein HupE